MWFFYIHSTSWYNQLSICIHHSINVTGHCSLHTYIPLTDKLLFSPLSVVHGLYLRLSRREDRGNVLVCVRVPVCACDLVFNNKTKSYLPQAWSVLFLPYPKTPSPSCIPSHSPSMTFLSPAAQPYGSLVCKYHRTRVHLRRQP